MEFPRLTLLLPPENVQSSFLQQVITQKRLAFFPIPQVIDSTYYAHLSYWLQQPPAINLPLAALTAIAAKLPAENGGWLLASLVQLHADLSQVYIFGNEHLQLSPDEISNLILKLNEFLVDDGLKIYSVDGLLWLIHLSSIPSIVSRPLAAVIGKNLQSYLPTGESASYWQKLLTEIQMLLFQSEVNQQRERKGLPVANSLWLWGEGSLQNVVPITCYAGIFTDDLAVQGFANLSNIPFFPLPESFTQLNHHVQQRPGHYFLTISEPKKAEEFLQQFYLPLAQAVQEKKLSSINIDVCEQNYYQINYVRFNFFKKILNL